MDYGSWLPITLCMPTKILNGSVYMPHEERLLDILNRVGVRRPESQSNFLILSDVTIYEANVRHEKLANAYVSKAAIIIAATWYNNPGRGIGARDGYKPYPFVEKSPMPMTS